MKTVWRNLRSSLCRQGIELRYQPLRVLYFIDDVLKYSDTQVVLGKYRATSSITN